MQFNLAKSHLKLVTIFLPIGAGLALALFDLAEYQEGLASKDWTAVDGKMLSNSIKAERPWMKRMIFIPSVVYSYHVSEDEVLRGDRMTFPDHVPAPETELKKLLERVEVGHKVTSYYDPKNKSHVTMFRGVRKAQYANLFVRDLAIAAIGAIFGLITMLRLRPELKGAPDTIQEQKVEGII